MSIGSSLEFRGTERFEIVSRLGAGGMGVVYAAYDRERDVKIALKTLSRPEPKYLYRLKNEFRALQDINHPNLVTMGELFEEQGHYFFTMELIDGVDFITYVQRPGFAPATIQNPTVDLLRGGLYAPTQLDEFPPGAESPDDSRQVPSDACCFDENRLRNGLAQLVRGLDVLHSTGRVHRDIKPSNILVTKEERVVLLDFGLVSQTDPEKISTEHLSPIGTAQYMAPEQAASETVGPEADWYSVGVILYVALTGQLPFPGAALQVMMAKQKTVPRRPRQLAPEVPEDLDELCISLLQPRPVDRANADRVRELLTLGKKAGPLQSISSTSMGTSFVGRQQELDTLFNAFALLQKGMPACVLVQGNSGLGKSELLRRFASTLRDQEMGAVVLSARCYERESVPFKAFDGIVDDLSRLLRRLPHHEAMQFVPRNSSLLSRVFPVLGYVYRFGEKPWTEQTVKDPHEVRILAFKALRELLARLAERHPVVLIIDDLQWADEDSLKLLRTVLQPPDAPAICLLAALRTPIEHERAREAVAGAAAVFPDDFLELEIGPLSTEDSSDLAVRLLGEELAVDGSRSSRAEQIIQESEGHPLFIRELVHHVLERGMTSETLHLDEVLVSRITALEPSARALIELVSVAGAPIQQGLAAKALDLRPATLYTLVTQLKVENLLRSRAMQMSDTVEPYHDRVREAVLANMSSDQRRILHAKVARALEASNRSEPELLARHLEEAGEHARAARYAIEAAARAEEMLAFDQAAGLYRKALELWPAETASGEPDSERRDLWVRLGQVLVDACQGSEAAAAFLQAVPGANATEELELKQRAAAQLLISGHVDQGIEITGQVFAALGMRMPRTPSRALLSLVRRRMQLRMRGLVFKERDASEVSNEELVRVDICRSLGVGLAVVDNIRGADFSTRYVLSALDVGESSRVAHALALEANFIAGSGQSNTRYYRKVVRTAESLMSQRKNDLARAYLEGSKAYGAFMSGSWSEARGLAEQALSYIRPVGTSWEYATMRLIMLWSLFYLGELEDLTALVDAWGQDALERGDFFAAAGILMGRPNVIFLGQDDPDRARREVEQMLGQWKVKDFYLQHYHALLALTHVDLYLGQPGQAHQRMGLEWPKLKQALLLLLPSVKYEALHLRGRVTLAMVGEAELSERKRYLARAQKDARRLARRKLGWTSALSLLLQAGVALQHGSVSEAASRLENAIAALDTADMRLYAAAARRRMGAMLGGDEGAAYQAAGDAFMSKQRVKDPERMTAMLAPGLSK